MKKIGIQPIPMMDRDKKDEVPEGQVRGFFFFFLRIYQGDSSASNPKNGQQEKIRRKTHKCQRQKDDLVL